MDGLTLIAALAVTGFVALVISWGCMEALLTTLGRLTRTSHDNRRKAKQGGRGEKLSRGAGEQGGGGEKDSSSSASSAPPLCPSACCAMMSACERSKPP